VLGVVPATCFMDVKLLSWTEKFPSFVVLECGKMYTYTLIIPSVQEHSVCILTRRTNLNPNLEQDSSDFFQVVELAMVQPALRCYLGCVRMMTVVLEIYQG
jgi:hypothetical protein